MIAELNMLDPADRCSSGLSVRYVVSLTKLEVGNKLKASLGILKRAEQVGKHLGVWHQSSLCLEAGVGQLLLGLCFSGRLKVIIGSMQSLQHCGA